MHLSKVSACKKDFIYIQYFIISTQHMLVHIINCHHDYFYSHYYQYFFFKPASSLSLTQPLADFEAEYIRLRRKQGIYPLNSHLPQISDLNIVSCPSRTLLLFLKNIYLFGYVGSQLWELSAAAYGIKFADQGWNLGTLHWDPSVLSTGLPGKSPSGTFEIVSAATWHPSGTGGFFSDPLFQPWR